nr:pyrroline-5-carboxylate reductase [uncultured Solibaculum sp.]
MEQHTIGFIGAGNMAGAILNGALQSGIFKGEQICIFDVLEEKCRPFAKKGVVVCSDSKKLVKQCDMVVLAVKPQVYPAVLEEIKECVTGQHVLISIAAGISTSYIQSAVGFECKVVRVMPNTPLLLGCGATALSKCACVTDSEFQIVSQLFSACGIVEILPESQMNSIIAVHGSSPAYVYRLAKAVIDGAVQQGIDANIAAKLFIQTIKGSALMLEQSGQTPDQLIQMVASPGGTTLAALREMDDTGFDQSIQKAMEACTKRAEELGK